MKKTVEYQEYLADGEKWRLHILISVDNSHGVRTREFSAEVVYATEQEADIHGIAFATPH